MNSYIFSLSDISIANNSTTVAVNNADSFFGLIEGSQLFIAGKLPATIIAHDTTARTLTLSDNWAQGDVNNESAQVLPLAAISNLLSAIDSNRALFNSINSSFLENDTVRKANASHDFLNGYTGTLQSYVAANGGGSGGSVITPESGGNVVVWQPRADGSDESQDFFDFIESIGASDDFVTVKVRPQFRPFFGPTEIYLKDRLSFEVSNIHIDFSGVQLVFGPAGGMRCYGKVAESPIEGKPRPVPNYPDDGLDTIATLPACRFYANANAGDSEILLFKDATIAAGDRLLLRGPSDVNGRAVINSLSMRYEDVIISSVQDLGTHYRVVIDGKLFMSYAANNTDSDWATKVINAGGDTNGDDFSYAIRFDQLWDVPAGSTEVTVDKQLVLALKVGDMVRIRGANDKFGFAIENPNGDSYEERFITNIVSDPTNLDIVTITLDAPLEFNYRWIWSNSPAFIQSIDQGAPFLDYTIVNKVDRYALGALPEGTRQVSNVPTNQIKVGDLVMVRANTLVSDVLPIGTVIAEDRTSNIATREFVVEVVDVLIDNSGVEPTSTIMFSDPLPREFDSTTALMKMDYIENFHVSNLKARFESLSPGLYHGVHIWGALRSSVRNSEIFNHTGNAFRLEHSYDCHSVDCYAHSPTGLEGGEGYGASLYATNQCSVLRFRGVYLRHTVLAFKGATNSVARDCNSWGALSSDYDVHGADENYVGFINCNAYGGTSIAGDTYTKAAFRCGNPRHIGAPKGCYVIGGEVADFHGFAIDVQTRTESFFVDGLRIRNTDHVFRSLEISSTGNWVNLSAYYNNRNIFTIGPVTLRNIFVESITPGLDPFITDNIVYGNLVERLHIENYTSLAAHDMPHIRIKGCDNFYAKNINLPNYTSDNAVTLENVTGLIDGLHANGKTLARLADCVDVEILSATGRTDWQAAINASNNTNCHVEIASVKSNSSNPTPTVNGDGSVQISLRGSLQ